ncbi:MAG: hypothetical protein JWL62_684 [Hyphomicrobiales bacterium]|nr:hypothetical protein [Hyphomicrobiales bacterium]
MSHSGDHDSDREAREARATLAGLSRAPGSVFDSAMQRGADHFAARDAAPEDGIELWGRRIGRALGLIFLLVLAVNLVTGWFF